ncbi:hypothetical protein diail_692 [Diaporthe ilicicola]|nr:hypothetical protein diail_692 [Diaporthe ilicicola]
MAAVNTARPRPPSAAASSNQQQQRASGSWDDLLRNKGQDKAQQARASRAQNERSGVVRPQSSGGGYGGGAGGRGYGGRPASQVMNHQQQQQPVRARMELHHAGQRSSQAFASHVAALNGGGNNATSPLSREVTVGPGSDSYHGGADRYGMPEINHYSLNNNNNNSNGNRRSQTFPQLQQAQPPPQRPGMYNRPRRLSNGGSMTGPRPGSFHSFDGTVDSQGRMRANSWGGMPVIEEAHAFETYPPAHVAAQPFRNSAPMWQRRPEPMKQQPAPPPRRPDPNELFNKLPVEVLRLVLDHVRRLHLEGEDGGGGGSGSSSCATCWMRDCCAVAVGNIRLLAVAREALYSDIQLVGRESPQLAKKLSKGGGGGGGAPLQQHAARLVLLRRTLRANRSLAAVVRSLKVPALPDGASVEPRRYHDVVASVVMACPNLERLDGFYPSYRHGAESHLLHALETRRKLKEMTWVVEAAPEASAEQDGARAGGKKATSSSKKRQSKKPPPVSPPTAEDSSSSSSIIPDHYPMTTAHANRFVMRHDNWKELTHLTIHCLPGARMAPRGIIGATLSLLPGIDSLYLSHLPASSFGDESLLGLPRALKRLGLSHCAGVTAAGLSAFSACAAAAPLESLTLIHQDVDGVDALVRVLARLGRLETLSLVQAAAPAVGDDPFLFMPYLASRSLRRLHWDILESGGGGGGGGGSTTTTTTRADDVLARSIAAGGFPRLRSIRAPNDPDGRFQALCKPQERADLAGDRYRNPGLAGQATTNNNSSSNQVNSSAEDLGGAVGARSSSDTKDSGKELLVGPPLREYGSDLHAARLAAQARLEAARGFPRFEANVVGEDGEVVSSEGLAGYVGDAASRIRYCLTPDEGGTDARGGLVVVDDLLGDGGEDLLRKGDVSRDAGGGFGTGIAPCCAVSGTREREAVQTRGKLIKRDSGGKSSSKDREKDKDKDRDGDEAGKPREGCTGRWNSYNDEGLVDKKSTSGDRWWHVERGRWRGRVELS